MNMIFSVILMEGYAFNDKESNIRQALRTLTPTQRERLINYHIKGMTLEQIAQKDGIAIKNAFSAIKRAERNLINAYERLEAAS